MQLLVDAGAALHAKTTPSPVNPHLHDFLTRQSMSPLHEAANIGHLEIVRLLIAAGADSNLEDG